MVLGAGLLLGALGSRYLTSRLNLNEDSFEGWVMLVAAFFVVTMVIFYENEDRGEGRKGQIEGKVGLLVENGRGGLACLLCVPDGGLGQGAERF